METCKDLFPLTKVLLICTERERNETLCGEMFGTCGWGGGREIDQSLLISPSSTTYHRETVERLRTLRVDMKEVYLIHSKGISEYCLGNKFDRSRLKTRNVGFLRFCRPKILPLYLMPKRVSSLSE